MLRWLGTTTLLLRLDYFPADAWTVLVESASLTPYKNVVVCGISKCWWRRLAASPVTNAMRTTSFSSLLCSLLHSLWPLTAETVRVLSTTAFSSHCPAKSHAFHGCNDFDRVFVSSISLAQILIAPWLRIGSCCSLLLKGYWSVSCARCFRFSQRQHQRQ